MSQRKNFRPPKSSSSLVEPSCKWFEYERTSEQSQYIVDDTSEARRIAKDIIAEDTKRYICAKGHERTDFEWLLSVKMKGTRKDQISSLLVTFEDSPIHNLDSFRLLVERLSDEECKHKDIFEIAEPLCQLLVNVVLPDRKLCSLNVRPLNEEFLKKCDKDQDCKRTLMLWFFEDELKKIYGKFVEFLQKKLMSSLFDKMKKQLLTNVYFLLCNKPENEARLLNTLVDKIGDPDTMLAGEALHLIRKLLEKHPPMKVVVVPELERIIFRKNIQPRVQHYALSALSQIELTPGDQKLCEHLVECYLSLFKVFVVTEQEVSTRLMSNLLMGLRNAFSHCSDTLKLNAENLHAIFTIIHSSQFNTAIQALMLVLQMTKNRPEIADRFYSALYQRMLSEDVLSTRLGEIFLKLLFNALREDPSTVRQKAFIKRLLRICLNASPSFIASALVLCSEVCRLSQNLDILSSEIRLEEELDEDTKNKDGAEKPGSWVLVELNQKAKPNYEYDALKRNPLYSNANYTCCFELRALSQHYHPTVALFANTLLQGGFVRYESNPFQDLKFTNFLDRFAYKNPKVKKGDPSGGRLPLTSGAFLKLKEDDIPTEEKYLHRFLKLRSKLKKRKEADSEEQMDELFDEYINNKFGLNKEKEIDSTDFASHYRSTGKTKKEKDSDEEFSDENFSNEEYSDETSTDDDFMNDEQASRRAGNLPRKRGKGAQGKDEYDEEEEKEFPELDDDFELSDEELENGPDEKDSKRRENGRSLQSKKFRKNERLAKRGKRDQHNKRRKFRK